ncbi:MAG TPA: hypothetical protein VLM43_06840 [Desulfobacterales bacterium]|nr:hypothetical protein [Desulfobacterales bacterium]
MAILQDTGTSAVGYAHDNRGNVISDKSRGISHLDYNIIDLPYRVEFNDGSTIDIWYDGYGNIMRKYIFSNVDTLPNGAYEMTVDYIDGFVYINQEMVSYYHPQGRVNKAEGGYRTEFFITDHE